jgi:hypothetical protein
MYLTNHREISRRGGLVLSDSYFSVIACVLCGQQYLYDEELLTIYVNPRDLSDRYLDVSGDESPCVGCGASEWDTVTLDLGSAEVVSGPWGWAR